MNFFADYKNGLKDPQVEELLDLIFFRPPAYFMVKFLQHFPVSPNQVTFVGLILGIVTFIFLIQGTVVSFLIGAVIFYIYGIVDNCDGMLARIKKNGTDMGKIIDGVADYLVNIMVYIGLGIGLVQNNFSFSININTWVVVVIAGGCHILHSSVFDFYLTSYLNGKNKIKDPLGDEYKYFTQKLSSQKLNMFTSILIKLYLIYLKGQLKSSSKDNLYLSDKFRAKNIIMLKLWGSIGPATHILVLIFSLVFNRVDIYFLYVLIVANILMVFLWLIQQFFNRQQQLLLKGISS